MGSDEGQIDYSVRYSKGEIIGSGVSGIVELISPDRVAKSPWTGIDEEICRREIQLEADVYRMLGDHRCFAKFFGLDTQDSSITLEYMRHGTVREYLKKHNEEISSVQRFEWALRATEGLRILHSAGIVHCDFSPRNLLLDSDLDIKVADFSGCSIHGSWSSAMGSVRFQLPREPTTPPSFSTDIFSLGSTIYEIATGNIPYEDVSSSQVNQLYELSQFPDLSGIQLGNIIRSCWLLDVDSAKEVQKMLSSTNLVI